MYSSQYNTLLKLPVSQLTNIRHRPYLIEFANEIASPCVALALIDRLRLDHMTDRQRYEYEQIEHVMACSLCSYLTAYEYLEADDWDSNKALAAIHQDQAVEQ
ncbi:hypothetical protein [Pseudomonas fluorescens]|jgi:hypothetical protein|uniref:Uncharacterized protein n=1 Tax=Pseudomonas fluorescens TaxID=294 RepID=A0A2T0HMZ9_PSEFL|nr:hypothetical protein [Pseudomonas fluorescens]PRW84452.1 hypothetical protein C7A10_28875 [Pseudomonas fluorescens]